MLNKGEGKYRPTPALIERLDHFSTEGFAVNVVVPMRGAPHVDFGNKEMGVPMGDGEAQRVMRAHEMMHLKISPNDFTPYLERGLASFTALQTAEEARTNYMVGKVKTDFDMKALSDGTELESGETMAKAEDWPGLAYFMAACVGTGSLNPFITGVRRVNPEWADDLRDAAKRLTQMLDKGFKAGDLASTREVGRGFIYGAIYMEEIAIWLDELAQANVMPEPEPQGEPQPQDGGEPREGQEQDDDAKQKQQEQQKQKQRQNRQKAINNKRDRIENPRDKRAHDARDDAKKDAPRTWTKVIEKTFPLPAFAPGGIGVKRIAANKGRHPRRMGRILTDPYRRVFDHKVKNGNGGIFVIDTSGSMSLTTDAVKTLLEAAPGSTVVGYSLAFKAGGPMYDAPNLFVLARRGRMVREVPDEVVHTPGHSDRTNGNDLPALEWALKNARAKEPVIWISDGGVHFGLMAFRDEARRSITAFLKRNRGKVKWVTDIGEAVRFLNEGGRL